MISHKKLEEDMFKYCFVYYSNRSWNQILRYSSEYRVSRQSDKTIGRSNTFINYFAKPLENTAMSLSLVIIFRAPPVNKLHLKKKIISIYETDKYLFFSSLQSERFLVPFIRYWMKWIPIPVYLINLFNKHEILFRHDLYEKWVVWIDEKLCSIFNLTDYIPKI